MEETKLSKILPMEEVLQKIKDFYLKCQNVNNLYDLYLKTNKKTDEEIFEAKWKELQREDGIYFRALSIEDSDWPSKKSYLIELKTEADVIVTESVFPDSDDSSKSFKLSPSRNKITAVRIAYALVDNQGDYTPESQFPFFGMYLMLLLSSGNKNFLFTATANTKRGCRVISQPTFETENLTIIGKQTEIKFENDQHFTNIINLVEEYLKLVNEAVGEEAFINNVKLN